MKSVRFPAIGLAPVLVCGLGLAGPSGVLLGQTLRIAYPADGALVYSGQTLAITVDADSSAFRSVMIGFHPKLGTSNEPELTRPPYRFSVLVSPDTHSGHHSIGAIGFPKSGGDPVSTSIDVDVERPDRPLKWKLNLGSLHCGFIGEATPLDVTGVFADGSLVGLEDSIYTTFVSDTPAVARVDQRGGMVTAVGPGFANITIAYNYPSPNTLSVRVPVSVPPELTVLPRTGSVYASHTQEFSAELFINPSLDQSVTWSISPQLGSIDQTGVYTAPSSVASRQGVTVTATSVAHSMTSASAQVWILPGRSSRY
jgi:hypothetical protein